MSTDTPPGPDTEEADEPGEGSELAAKVVLAAVAIGAVWGLVVAFPWIAYVLIGAGLAVGWQRAAAWARARKESEEGQAEEEQPDIVGALRQLGQKGDHVLLTQLRKQLGAADTKAVRKLLKAEKIRVRAGVRTPAGNGPGVHKDDIPAAPPEVGGGHGEGCCCRSGNNANANNRPGEGPGEGLRVVPIGTDGKIIYDPADTIRHHSVD